MQPLPCTVIVAHARRKPRRPDSRRGFAASSDSLEGTCLPRLSPDRLPSGLSTRPGGGSPRPARAGRSGRRRPRHEGVAAVQHLDEVTALEPSEADAAMTAKLKSKGIDFAAARAAFNRGDREAVERFLEAIAPPPPSMVAVLERRINAALRAMAKSAVVAHAPAAHVAARPRERHAGATVRARAPDDDRPRRRAPLDGEERRGLRILYDRARRAWIAATKECSGPCGLEKPRDTFRPARAVCMNCEAGAAAARREAVTA